MTALSPEVSVIVPTYHRRESVRRLLQALAAQEPATPAYEAIVSIDGAEDGTHELVTRMRLPFPARAVFQPHRGRARACNAGARASRGDILVFLDDDMEPVPTFVRAHRAAHPAGSRRGVVGAAPIELAGASGAARFIGLGFRARLEKIARPGYALEFKDVYTGNFSIPRQLFVDVGGFDEDFTLYGHEDYELALRLQRAGVELVYSPEALARQHYEKDFRRLAADTIARGRTAVLFAAKHPDIAHRLKLGTLEGQDSPRWRRLRSALLAVTNIVPWLAPGIAVSADWLARVDRARAGWYHTLALDYCYWHGVRRARTFRNARHSNPAGSLEPRRP